MEENGQKNVVDNVENMEQSQSENEEELKEEQSILKGIWKIVEFILLFGGIVGGFLGLVLVMLGGVYSLIGKVCPGILEIIGLRVARMGSGQLFEFVIKYGIIGLLINIGIIVASCLLILLVKVIPIIFFYATTFSNKLSYTYDRSIRQNRADKMGGDFLLFVFDSRDNYSGWRSDCA